MTPHFWDQARRELGRRDPVLRGLMKVWKAEALQNRGDPFLTLARSIVGQQISVKAAQTIWDRLVSKALERGEAKVLTPQRLTGMRMSTLRACGLSERKVEYLKELARAFHSGELDGRHLASLEDEEVILKLTTIRGIGRWTAEMFLIFNLDRPDVLPLDDVGLLRAIAVNYGEIQPEIDAPKASRAQAAALAEQWKPWRSVATWYMWRSLDPLPVEY